MKLYKLIFNKLSLLDKYWQQSALEKSTWEARDDRDKFCFHMIIPLIELPHLVYERLKLCIANFTRVNLDNLIINKNNCTRININDG